MLYFSLLLPYYANALASFRYATLISRQVLAPPLISSSIQPQLSMTGISNQRFQIHHLGPSLIYLNQRN